MCLPLNKARVHHWASDESVAARKAVAQLTCPNRTFFQTTSVYFLSVWVSWLIKSCYLRNACKEENRVKCKEDKLTPRTLHLTRWISLAFSFFLHHKVTVATYLHGVKEAEYAKEELAKVRG